MREFVVNIIFPDDFPERRTGEAGDMAAHMPGGIHSGQQRRLAGCALGNARDPQPRIEGASVTGEQVEEIRADAAIDRIDVRVTAPHAKPIDKDKHRSGGRWHRYTPNSSRLANRSGRPAAMIFFWAVAISYSTRRISNWRAVVS